MGFKVRTIRKVMWGGGGEGNFRAAGIFFRYQIPVRIFFRPLHEYFLGLIGVQEFFFIKFSLARICFFVLRPPPPPPPPYKISNGPSLRTATPTKKFADKSHQNSSRLPEHLQIAQKNRLCELAFVKLRRRISRRAASE